jgi:mono/diheme cytochrome c family protein
MSFAAAGRGKVTVSIKGKVVFEAAGDDLAQKVGEVVRLDKGANALLVTYESPEKGDAFVRLYWKEQKGLRPEPVPPTAFTHDASAVGDAVGRRLREGRQLIEDLRCTKCHAAPASPMGMPELATDAPALSDVGDRLNAEWVAAWVENPKSLRKDAHMPRVLRDGAAARDVAAYLATLRAARTQSRAIDPALAPRGGQLYAMLNCVACHTPPDAQTQDAKDPRVPHRHVAAKFQPHALAEYLLNPAAHYAWNPMPNFKLTREEADALAAFILEKAAKPAGKPVQGNAENGRRLVQSSGCLNCHTIERESTSLKAPELAATPPLNWDRGCVAADAAARKNAPDFGLSDEQRAALKAFAATDRSSLARDEASEFSTRQFAAMRCTGCHARDGNESLISTDFAADEASLTATYPPPPPPPGAEARGEIFAPDQRPPLLTWAGEKLRPQWAAAFIAGKVDYKPRPYLRARMPAWPTRAQGLAKGLAAEHGYGPVAPAYPAPDEAMAKTGQKLIGAAGGFSCVQCHAVGNKPPLAPFEAPALNFAYVSERLRKEHYLRWVFNPIKVDPATKMPAFADADGKTPLRDVYDGDASKQFEAIWQFLLRGKDVTPPGGG